MFSATRGVKTINTNVFCCDTFGNEEVSCHPAGWEQRDHVTQSHVGTHHITCLLINFCQHFRTLSLLPALSLSATELLLEPSGGKAVLIDTNLVAKRSSGALMPSDPPAASAKIDEEVTQVQVVRPILAFTHPCFLRSIKEQQFCLTKLCMLCKKH